MKKKQNKKKTFTDFLLTFLLVIAIGVFLFAAYQLYSIYSEYKKGVDEYNQLEELAVSENPNQKQADEEETEEEEDTPQPPITVDFEELKKINPDVVGWIYIEGIDVSYPVVQGEDNDEYLHHTYEGTYNFAGSIFLEYTNQGDFSDCNTIIYGHNMKNGSMFGKLKELREDAYGKSPYIWILTPEGDYRYEIFSAYVTPVNSDTYTLFKGPDKEFQEYVEAMKENSEIETRDMEVDVKDKVITLSTCTGNESTRYVVQAIRIDEV